MKDASRYLVVTADDLGRSQAVNRAVELSCQWGIVTAASIIAGGEAFDEAAALALRYPRLSVGLHVTLSDGCAVLPHSRIPGLVDHQGRFEKSPFRAGLRYWRYRRYLTAQIEAEVEAQFGRAEAAGIRLTHVDCHHHLHMHPVLFDIVARQAAQRGIPWIRIPREPLSLIAGLHLRLLDVKPLVEWLVFGLLTDRSLRIAHSLGMRVMTNVAGLSGTGRINEHYLLALLGTIGAATSELYLHPAMDTAHGREEMKAATAGSVKERVSGLGFRLVGFRELSGCSANVEMAAGT